MISRNRKPFSQKMTSVADNFFSCSMSAADWLISVSSLIAVINLCGVVKIPTLWCKIFSTLCISKKLPAISSAGWSFERLGSRPLMPFKIYRVKYPAADKNALVQIVARSLFS